MKCEKNMQEMLAAWLDGELAPAEAERFEKHLGECALCREDLAVWNEIRDVLRREPVEMAPPEGFAAGVMARIPERRAGWWETVTSNWRRGLAAAAASLLIALGGVGATIYYGIMPGAQVVDNSGQNQHAITENIGGGSNLPLAGNVNMNPGTTTNPDEPVSNRDNAGETDRSGGENNPGTTGGGGVSPANSGGTARATEMLALLNVEKERVIYTTLLRVRVGDSDGVETAVAGLAGKYRATHRLMESQNTAAGKRLAFEILVEGDMAGGLLKNLEATGQVMNRETDRKDISGSYNEQVEQYQSLDAQLQTAGSEEEKQLLTSKMSAIEKQLKAWETESGMHKVVFWVES